VKVKESFLLSINKRNGEKGKPHTKREKEKRAKEEGVLPREKRSNKRKNTINRQERERFFLSIKSMKGKRERKEGEEREKGETNLITTRESKGGGGGSIAPREGNGVCRVATYSTQSLLFFGIF
jgi:hypothetical protein